VKRDVVGDRHAVAIEPAIEAAEIDIELFDLGRPVGRERAFESGADRPAGIVAALKPFQAGSTITGMVE
jgi:hypothetical protein